MTLEEIVPEEQTLSLTATLSECNMGICDEICTLCSIEGDWMSEVDAVLEAEFPEEFRKMESMGRGLMADHPYWARYKALWAAYRTPCFYWESDDSEAYICTKHWNQIGRLLEKSHEARRHSS